MDEIQWKATNGPFSIDQFRFIKITDKNSRCDFRISWLDKLFPTFCLDFSGARIHTRHYYQQFYELKISIWNWSIKNGPSVAFHCTRISKLINALDIKLFSKYYFWDRYFWNQENKWILTFWREKKQILSQNWWNREHF